MFHATYTACMRRFTSYQKALQSVTCAEILFDDLSKRGNGEKVQSSKFCTLAAGVGQLEVLHYVDFVVQVTWDGETTALAACYGCIDCLKYAHENGCPWYAYTTSSDAKKGH